MGTERLGSKTIQLACGTLLVVEGSTKGRTATLSSGRLIIGAGEDVSLRVPDRGVSRHHAELAAVGREFRIRDLESTNGTFVNDTRIVEAFLVPGDVIGVGVCKIRFEPRQEEVKILPSARDNFGPLYGTGIAMRQLFGLLERVAPTEATVLIQGETGTGKDLVARAIHAASPRSAGRLVVFDCSSPNPDLIASELFGHLEGAFTGASRRRQGAFVSASGGTVFLDEVGELPLELQPNLLRVLEAREVRPVGSTETHPVDIRVVAATNRDLSQMIEDGKFRQDLYFRLAVVRVELPSLRQRREDIRGLSEQLLEAFRGSRTSLQLSDEAVAILTAQSWTGNVRELRNVLERSVALTTGDILSPSDLMLNTKKSGAPVAPEIMEGSLAELEKEAIRQTLLRTGGNQRETARILDIHRDTLRVKMQKYGLKDRKGTDES